MPILLKRKSGEITPFRNADFIPAFYTFKEQKIIQIYSFMRIKSKNCIFFVFI